MESDIKALDMLSPLYYLPQFAKPLEDYGVSIGEWLNRAGLDEDILNNPSEYVPISTYINLLEDALQLTNRSDYGLLVGNKLTLEDHGVLSLIISASSSLYEAIDIMQPYVRLRTTLIGTSMQIDNDELKLIFEPRIGIGLAGQVISETAVLATKKISHEISPSQKTCKSVAFSFPRPPHAELAEKLFCCPLLYEQNWTGIVFDLEAMQTQRKKKDPLAIADALEICERELERINANSTMIAQLERLLTKNARIFPTLEAAAELLNLTPRTLHRRLQSEGSSYKQVLESVRLRLAKEYLYTKKVSVKETAYMLGYSDTANFRRAFKRWYGFPPSQGSC